MKHYSKEDWIRYKFGTVIEEKDTMTEHLAKCDECMEVFLSLINEDEITEASALLSSDFTPRVMSAVRFTAKNNSKKKVSKTKQKTMIAYYVAAASITLIFMSSGFFQALVDIVPKVTASQAMREPEVKKINLDWSNKVVNKAALWIKDFETQGGQKQ